MEYGTDSADVVVHISTPNNKIFQSIRHETGFTLIEVMITMIIMTFGLLACGQMVAGAIKSATLARTKGNAAIVAQNQLERLADLYRRDRHDPSISIGTQGPVWVEIANPIHHRVLHRFRVEWIVTPVTGTNIMAHTRNIRLSVIPIDESKNNLFKPGWNERITMSMVLSTRAQG